VTATETQVARVARRCLMLAGVLGAAGVLIGAFGAHGLPGWLADRGLDAELIEKRLAQLDVGVLYHLLHTVALASLAASLLWLPVRTVRIVGGLFVLGIVVFSGSLYLLVALNQPKWGMVTPIGGLSLIFGWTWLAIAAGRGPKVGKPSETNRSEA